MQVHYQEILRSLGCAGNEVDITKLQRCPLHPEQGNTLRIREDPVTGHTHFYCTAPRCGFSGDAIALVARARKIPFTAAVELFRVGGEFRKAIIDPDVADMWLDSCLHNQASQTRIKEYLGRCQQALRQQQGSTLRKLLADQGALRRADKTLATLAPGVGLLLFDDIPTALKDLGCPVYRQGCYAIYPYTYDKRVVGVRIQNLMEHGLQEQKTIKLIDSSVGLFMEDNLTADTERVLLALDELTACKLYTKFCQTSTTAPSLVATSTLPLPFRYRRAKEIVVMSTKENPLTLEKAFELMGVEEPVEDGCDVTISVCTLRPPLNKVSPTQLDSRVKDKTSVYKLTLAHWITLRMREFVEDKNKEAIYRAVDTNPLPEGKHAELLAHIARVGDPELQEILIAATNQNRGRFILGNGNMVWKTPQGFKRTTTGSDSPFLSNMIFTVDTCILGPDKKLTYICQVHTADNKLPSVVVKLQDADLKNGESVVHAVDAAFAAAGHKAYVAFYNKPGYKWRDIAARIAKGRPVVQEISQLGADDKLHVHFPHFALRLASNDIMPQEGAASLPDNVLQQYRGLRPLSSQKPSFSALKQIVTTDKPNSYVAAFIAALDHMLYSLKMNVVNTDIGQPAAPRHLFYVEPETGLWAPIFQQLSQLFTGLALPIHMPATGVREHLIAMQGLGPLPYIAMLPQMPPQKLGAIVSDSPVSLISVIDGKRASVLANDPRVSFVLPVDYAETACKLDPADILELQRALPGILLKFINQSMSPAELQELGRTTLPPAVAAHELLIKTIEGSWMLPEDLVQNHYAAIGMTSALAFFHALNALLFAHDAAPAKLGITLEHSEPTARRLRDTNPPLIFIGRNTVTMSRQLVDIVNPKNKEGQLFTARGLEEEFKRKGYLGDGHGYLAQKRYWTLDKAIWEKYVVKIPLTLVKTVTAGNVIQLERITA